MCRAAAEAAAQSELAALVCAHREDEEEGEDCTAAQQTHRLVQDEAVSFMHSNPDVGTVLILTNLICIYML